MKAYNKTLSGAQNQAPPTEKIYEKNPRPRNSEESGDWDDAPYVFGLQYWKNERN